MTDIREVGEIIRFHRKTSGLTQIELADLSGVGKTVITEIEKGKETVKMNTLLKILRVLNIQVELTSPLMHKYQGIK